MKKERNQWIEKLELEDMRRINRQGRSTVTGGIRKKNAVSWEPDTVITFCRKNRQNRSIPAQGVLLQSHFPVSAIASGNFEEGWVKDEQHVDRISQTF